MGEPRDDQREPPGPLTVSHIGRYQIKGELGRGAMGVVYLAIDPAIGRPLAIKTIRIRDIHNPAQQQKLRERLFREARSAGVLSHPNIVTIYDTDEDDGVAYIAMALVNGPSLDKALSGSVSIPGPQMLHVLRQSASALDYAHSRGVIHRDVKPGNIMIDEDGSVRITDFGIAKFVAPGDTTETRTVTGTPGYMSPEQVQGRALDGRSDQFSLAVIAYEMLTGERPFQGEHLSTIVYRIVAEEPSEVHRINPTLTPQIDLVLRKALSKRPDGRFITCAAFVGALEMACAESRGWKPIIPGAAQSMPTTAIQRPRPAVQVSAPQQSPGRQLAPSAVRAGQLVPPPSRSRVWPVLAGVFVAAGLCAVFAWEAGLLPGLSTFGSSTESAAQAKYKNKQSGTPAAPPDDPAAPATTPAPDTPKPSPLPGPVTDLSNRAPPTSSPQSGTPDAALNPATTAATQPVRPRAQDIWVTTNPPGAKVSLDDNPAGTCLSPCMLHGTAGIHHLTYSLAGYKTEYREIHVGETAIDAPLISLAMPSGTLLLTTTPAGATILIDGKAVPGVTPAQITLAPGGHSVTVQQGGRTQTQQVEIQESPVYLRFTLGR